MRKDDVKRFADFDWKAIGYLTSIASVFFLGATSAHQASHPPVWYYPALVVGMATSILGMGFRYLAHIQQKKEMAKKPNRPNARKAR